MIYIKSCPFCGGNARLKRKNRTVIGSAIKRNTYVYCPNCDVRGKRFLYEDYKDAEQRGIEAWNERI